MYMWMITFTLHELEENNWFTFLIEIWEFFMKTSILLISINCRIKKSLYHFYFYHLNGPYYEPLSPSNSPLVSRYIHSIIQRYIISPSHHSKQKTMWSDAYHNFQDSKWRKWFFSKENAIKLAKCLFQMPRK
jgi:hypothetical protein